MCARFIHLFILICGMFCVFVLHARHHIIPYIRILSHSNEYFRIEIKQMKLWKKEKRQQMTIPTTTTTHINIPVSVDLTRLHSSFPFYDSGGLFRIAHSRSMHRYLSRSFYTLNCGLIRKRFHSNREKNVHFDGDTEKTP